MSQTSHKTDFKPVEIGSIILGVKPSMKEQDTLTQPNPEKITWSRKNRVVQHEIPGFPDRTTRTSFTTLWQCQMSIITINQVFLEKFQGLAEDPGPYMVKTGFGKNLSMYCIDASASQEAAEDDTIWHWELTFLEERD